MARSSLKSRTVLAPPSRMFASPLRTALRTALLAAMLVGPTACGPSAQELSASTTQDLTETEAIRIAYPALLTDGASPPFASGARSDSLGLHFEGTEGILVVYWKKGSSPSGKLQRLVALVDGFEVADTTEYGLTIPELSRYWATDAAPTHELLLRIEEIAGAAGAVIAERSLTFDAKPSETLNEGLGAAIDSAQQDYAGSGIIGLLRESESDPTTVPVEYTGTPNTLYYNGRKVAESSGLNACYCAGLTFDAFVRGWKVWASANEHDRNNLNGLSGWNMIELRTLWYAPSSGARGPQEALERAGVGRAVPLEQAKPGDVVQFWRSNGKGGHSVFFKEWARDGAGNIEGITFTSCHFAKTGDSDPGYWETTEYFGPKQEQVNPAAVYPVRLMAPADWVPSTL
jgi:hypothetical protein